MSAIPSRPKLAANPAVASGSAPAAEYVTRAAARSHRLQRLRGTEGILFLLALLLLWHFISSSSHFNGKYLFPSPTVTWKALLDSLPELLRGTLSSLVVLTPALALAIALGIGWGLLVGTTPVLQRMFSPFARFASPVPPTIYIPYAIALMPTFRSAAGSVIFIGVFWPIFLNAASGALAMPQRYRDNARILGLKKSEYLWRIVLPASLPHIFSGISVGLVFAFIMLTVAELFGASSGLGRFVQLYADYADYPRMVAGIIYTGVVVLLSMELLERIKKRALFWQK